MRVLFVAEDSVMCNNGTPCSLLADGVSRDEAIAVARKYLDEQWPDEDREYYQEYYDRGVAALDAFAAVTPDRDAEVQPPEHHTVSITAEYGWIFLTT